MQQQKMKPAVRRFIFYGLGLLLIATGIFIYDKYTRGIKTGATSSTLFSTSTPVSGSTILRLAGSITIGETLAPALVKGFMEKTGYSNVQIINNKDEKIVVGTKNGNTDKIEVSTKGGITNGMSLINSSSIDICMSSCEETGLIEHVIGIDGIIVIVNKNSALHSISIPQLRAIYSGAKEFTGNAYCQQKTSGIYRVFEDECMDEQPLGNSVKFLNSDAEVLNAVANDPNGVGIVNYSLVNNNTIKSLPLAELDGEAPIIANTSTIESERYPLTREFYFYNKTTTPLITDFIKFIESGDGQKIVSDNGYINMNIRFNNNKENPEAEPGDPAPYTALINKDQMITTEFRFASGSQHLDSRGLEDIVRLVSFLGQSQNRNRRVILVGFTDNVGDPAGNVALSIKRAKSVADVLSASGVQIKATMGFGSIREVRSNDDEVDRAENRRVEVWLEN